MADGPPLGTRYDRFVWWFTYWLEWQVSRHSEKMRKEFLKAVGHEDGPWEETPRWHPYRWFGFDLRQLTLEYGGMSKFWIYGRSQRVARDMLRSAYATDVDPKEIKR